MRARLLGSVLGLALVITSSAASAQAPAQAPAAPPAAPNTTPSPAVVPAAQVAPGATPATPAGPPATTGVQPAAPAAPAGSADATDKRVIGQHEIDNWDSSQPVPAGYHAESKHNWGLIIGGVAITGLMWGVTVLGALVYRAGDDIVTGTQNAFGQKTTQTSVTPLFIPVVGPFIQVATTGGRFDGKAVLILDGLVQAGGAAMFLYGVLVPKEYLKRDAKLTLPGMKDVVVAPMLTGGQTGVGLVGRF